MKQTNLFGFTQRRISYLLRKLKLGYTTISSSALLKIIVTGFIVCCVEPLMAQSFLSASGTKIVNTSGSEVILKGINLGNWALQEGWMISADGNKPGTQGEMKKILYDQGQSNTQVEAYYQSWRDNFITKADIDFIASKGMNCVRFPMHYELFLTSAQRAVRNSVIHNKSNYNNYKTQLGNWVASNSIATDYNVEGYRLINNLLSWCAANNMYVILDMHAVPGSQGTDRNIADCLAVENDLWYSTVNQDVLNAIWSNISKKYKNDSRIAMYDLINEPNNTNSVSIHSMHQRLITTIRNNGDNHLLMIEGNAWGNNYTDNQPTTFSPRTNLVYNIHRYKNATSTSTTMSDANQIQELGNTQNFRNTYQVPIFCGETGLNDYNWLKNNIAALDATRIGWCIWTYKWHTDWNAWGFGRIPGAYPADGVSAMSAVIENIKFANLVKNTNSAYWSALNTSSPAPVWVTGVSVSPVTASLNTGTTQQLTVIITPSNATNKTVSWASSNSGIATVSASGLVKGIAPGTAVITVTTQDGSKTATSIIAVTNTQGPYGGASLAVPGTIEAENFDNGGEGTGYHDAETTNQGGQYRSTEGVDIESCSEGGYDVGWTSTGEWMKYTVNVATAGTYTIDLRVASPSASGSLHIEFNGTDKTGLVSIPNTGGWQNWQTVSKAGVSLAAGQQTMRIYVDAAGFNLNKLTLNSSAATVAVTGVSVSPSSASLNIGATQQLLATVSPANATNKTVSWISSNTGIATVNASGLVTGIAAGTTTITVTTQDGSKTATASIVINAASSSSVFPGYYNILSVNSLKALDVKDKSVVSGAYIQQWDLSANGGGDNQRWRLDNAGNNSYYIKVKSTQLCLATETSGTGNGVKVIQQTCISNSNTQKWNMVNIGNNKYEIININSGKALDVTDVSTANGALIQTWAYGGGTNQQWTLIQVEPTTVMRSIRPAEKDVSGNIAVYPSPASNTIKLSSSLFSNYSSVEILNTTGSVIMQRRIIPGSASITIGVEQLIKSIYFVRLANNGRYSAIKNFIKQ